MAVIVSFTMASDELDEDDARRPKETLGVKPNVKSCQVSKEETEYYRKKFSDVSAVRSHRIHCTSCDKHLGSAPAAQRKRFEHPVLKVLMCLQCYDFYTSGEFETDRDGSELYCRWCGQGGRVYCCTACPFVFCKECVVRNLGTSAAESIERSADWTCYGCRPDDIWTHRAINRALKQYSSQLYSIDPQERTPQQNVLLTRDCTTCCKKDKQNVTGIKRPLPEPDDRTAKKVTTRHQRILPKPTLTVRAVMVNPIPKPVSEVVAPVPVAAPAPRPPISAGENGDEVVCTPDILTIGEEDECVKPTPQSSTGAEEPTSAAAVDDRKIIEDPPPKKPYVQVKPASKLLESTATPKNPMPPPPSLIYPTAVLKVAPKDLPPLVKTAVATDALRPIRPRPAQKVAVQNAPTQQIKIVSPDGRSFYIDPAKLVPPGVPAAPIVLQTLRPAPASADTSTKRLDWFDTSISEWQLLAQAHTASVVELAHLYNGGATNPDHLYTNFQARIQSAIDKMEDLKQRLAHDYFDRAPSSRAPGAKNDDPRVVAPFGRPIPMVAAVPAADASMTITGDPATDVDVKPKLDALPTERSTIDANSKDVRCSGVIVKNLDEEWDERGIVGGTANTGGSPFESGKRPADATRGTRASNKRPERRMKRSTYDYGARATHGRYESDADDESTDGDESADGDDSDYVAEEDEEDDSDSVASNKSSVKSAVASDGGESAAQEVDDETIENKTDGWNGGGDDDDDVTVNEDEWKDVLGGEPEVKYDPDADERVERRSVAEDVGSKNDDGSVVDVVRSNDSTSSSERKNERG